MGLTINCRGLNTLDACQSNGCYSAANHKHFIVAKAVSAHHVALTTGNHNVALGVGTSVINSV